MRRILFSASILVALSAPSIAGAADRKECNDDYAQSQVLRDSGKLIEARELLRVCARDECGNAIPRECAGWLADVERRIPGVVVAAKNGAGADLVDVKVAVDGTVRATKLDGRAIEVDPGEHAFVFETASGERVEQKIVVQEGERDRRISVTIGAGATTVASTDTPKPVEGFEAPSSGGSTLRTAGFVVGGAGIVGLAVGGIFGLRAMSKKSDAACDANNFCDPAPLSDARSAATISTIGFIAGGVLLAGGIALVVWAPHSTAETKTARLEAAPIIGNGNGGLMLRGRW